MRKPPADILSRLRPVPTYSGRPTTCPHDVVGVDPAAAPCRIGVVEATEPVLLLFLSAGCLGCRDLWEGLADLQGGLHGSARLAVVTKSPGDEDPAAIAALAGPAPDALGVAVVMSTAAYRDYRVAGPPFLAVAAADAVLTESVAWGLDQTLEISLSALRTA
jgi:hypothetical protein